LGGRVILLGVNIDHSATLRQARYRDAGEDVDASVEPDPVAIAERSVRAGADGITVHLREDRRHIQDMDVWRLRELPSIRINLELACAQPMIDLALRFKPQAVCVVPENRKEVTTEGGLDVIGGRERVEACVRAMNAAGIEASLFIDPDTAQIELSAKMGAPVVELHTGAYSNAYYTADRAREFERLREGAALAHKLGLKVKNAGHGINYVNIAEVRTLPHLNELNIGHSIMSRALFSGIEEAVREMKSRMNP
jgi:pyridoxine 5-phosphate synthase